MMRMSFAEYESRIRSNPAVLRSSWEFAFEFAEIFQENLEDYDLDDDVHTYLDATGDQLQEGLVGQQELFPVQNRSLQRRARDQYLAAFADYLDTKERYTFEWIDIVETEDEVRPAADGEVATTIRSPMQQDPFLLYTDEEVDEYLADMDAANRLEDIPETVRKGAKQSTSLSPLDAYIQDELLEAYGGDIEAVRENHVEVVPLPTAQQDAAPV